MHLIFYFRGRKQCLQWYYYWITHQVSVEMTKKKPVTWRHVILYPMKQAEVWRRAKGFRKPILHILQDVNKELNPIHSVFFYLSAHPILYSSHKD